MDFIKSGRIVTGEVIYQISTKSTKYDDSNGQHDDADDDEVNDYKDDEYDKNDDNHHHLLSVDFIKSGRIVTREVIHQMWDYHRKSRISRPYPSI